MNIILIYKEHRENIANSYVKSFGNLQQISHSFYNSDKANIQWHIHYLNLEECIIQERQENIEDMYVIYFFHTYVQLSVL